MMSFFEKLKKGMGIEEVEEKLAELTLHGFPQGTVDLLRANARRALEAIETIKGLRELIEVKDRVIFELKRQLAESNG